MALKLTWSARRQLLYYAVGLVICAVLLIVFYNLFLTTSPTCFDGKQNQNERGVDCGGVCSLVCTQDTHNLVVLWSRSFLVAPGYYTAAAYVHNDNVTAGARAVQYSFQLFDDKNSLVIERDGQMDVPPTQAITVVEPSINVGNRTVSRALFSFITTPVWHAAAIPMLRVSNQDLAQDGSRLSATVSNDTVSNLRKVVVTAVLYDSAGVAKAASKSTVDIAPKSSQSVQFTWPLGNPQIVRAEITVLSPF
ncbi:MAG: hypothetical protein V4474_04265 [Patescibacteria group bacterium]